MLHLKRHYIIWNERSRKCLPYNTTFQTYKYLTFIFCNSITIIIKKENAHTKTVRYLQLNKQSF